MPRLKREYSYKPIGLSMRLRSRLAVGLLSCALLASACGAPPEKVKPGDGSVPESIQLDKNHDPAGHFNWGYTLATTSWDPTQSVSGFDQNFLMPVYDRLVYNNPDGELEPMLATSWTGSDDGKSLTMKLRKDIKFSDGTAFDAAAAKLNLDRAMGSGSRIAGEVGQLESVDVVDPMTIKLNVSTGLGSLLGSLSGRPGMMASPTAIAAGTLGQQPVGIGGYVVTEIVPGDRTSYEKTPGYWDPEAQKVATMTYTLMTDDQTRLNALQTGELNGANLRQNQVQAALDMGLNVVAKPSALFVYLTVNSSFEPFNDPKVREALNYAIDRKAIADGLYEGFCTPQIQPWPASSFAYSKEIGDGLDIWPHDPEKAKKLLKEAGYADGLDMVTVTTNVSGYVKLSEAVQDQLKDVGIKMEIKPLPTAQVVEEFSVLKSLQGNINPYSGLPDPDGVVTRHFAKGSVYDVGEPIAASTLELAKKAASPVDPEERAPLYAKLMQDMIDKPTHLMPICMLHTTEAYIDGVSNVEAYASGVADKRGVAVNKKD